MKVENAVVGARVRSNRDFATVDKGTEAAIDEDYGPGIMVAWDLEDRPLPEGYPEGVDDPRVRKPRTVGPRGHEVPLLRVLRDGFSKETDLRFLELAERGGEST